MVVQEIYEAALPLSLLHESPWNHRKTFRPGPMAELTESVKKTGIITPLIARPKPGEPGMYELAAGHRRRRAALAAGLEHVPVRIRAYDDDQFREVLSIENLQREDLHPLEEADGYRDLMETKGWTVEGLADRLGRSARYIHQRMKLLDLTAELKEDLFAERIEVSHALSLARLEPVTQKWIRKERLFDSRVGNTVISVAALRSVVNREVFINLNSAPFDKADAGLVPKAGACTGCWKRTGFSPTLFDIAEIGKADMCLDRSCFHQKSNAHASAQVKKLTAKDGEKPLLVSCDYSYAGDPRRKKDVLYRNDWNPAGAKKPCPSAKAAVVVEGGVNNGGEYKTGQAINVCISRTCLIHNPHSQTARRAEATPAELRKELQRKQEAECHDAVQEALIGAAVESVKWPPFLNDLRAVVRSVWTRMYNDHRIKALARRGLKRYTSRFDGDALTDQIETMDQTQLLQVLVEVALRQGGTAVETDDDSSEDLLAVLTKRLGDIAKFLEAEAKAPIEAKFAKRFTALDKRVKAEKAAKPAKAKGGKVSK